MIFNNLRRLHFYICLIFVFMFLFLPTMLVLGQNKTTQSVTLDKDEILETHGTLESSGVEYDSSGWTNFTVKILSATYQEDGDNGSLLIDTVLLRVYSGASVDSADRIFNADILSGDEYNVLVNDESIVTLVFYVFNLFRELNSVEVSYSIEAMGVSVGAPGIVSQGSLPFSAIAVITALAALGTLVVLVSLRRVKLKR